MQEDLNLAINKAETANNAKSSFLANMSHEIRTPMNSIMGFAELAQDLAIVPQVKDYLSKISDSTKWLLSIINDILDISKIEAGKMELEQVPFDLHDVFSRCQSVILLGLEKKNLDLHINAEPSIGKKLLGDPVRLYQVLMNLLSNAVKFTNKGTIYLSSSIKKSPFQSPQPSDKTTVYFEVKDSGIGMTSEQIDKIFAPFIQADSSTTRDYGGTGLGLAISKNIVELMGGELIVKSSPDVGSIFCFEITFDTIDVFDDTSNQSGFDVILKPCFEGLVLVCDDNSMNQEVVCAHLAHVGLRTVTAENGKIGVEMVEERIKNKEKPFDMIFMDMFMPVMDGMEAASKIMALNTGSPIVAVTANVMASELEEYKRCGMQDYLGKPFTSQELWRTLLKYFVPIDVLPHARDHVDGYNNDELQRKLQINFLQNNQNVHIKIMEAVTAGDIQFAHRLAHSLKGNAGLLGKTGLKKAAAEVETMLKDRTAFVWETKMSNLSTELQLVFEELKPLFAETVVQEKARTLGAAEALVLFDKLEVMLKNLNPECLSLLDDLRIVTGTGELIQQIENYEFETASITLDALKGRLTHEEK
jgi:CheY-like chemotaxis protein